MCHLGQRSLPHILPTTGEMVLFSGRRMWRTGCRKLTLSSITTRTNTLMVRQRLLLPGNGVIFLYSSRTAENKYHQGRLPREPACWRPAISRHHMAFWGEGVWRPSLWLHWYDGGPILRHTCLTGTIISASVSCFPLFSWTSDSWRVLLLFFSCLRWAIFCVAAVCYGSVFVLLSCWLCFYFMFIKLWSFLIVNQTVASSRLVLFMKVASIRHNLIRL